MINVNTAINNTGLNDMCAKYLMCFVLDIDLSDLPLQLDFDLSDEQLKSFNELVALRKAGKPVDAIIGVKHFWNGEFTVNESVLSPRPDSECIIESVLKHFTDTGKQYNILDLGTGSGCLLISLLMEYKNANGVGIDVSNDALKIAKTNGEKNNVSDRVKFIQSDWLNNLPNKKYDIIVANPPYVKTDEIDELAVEVKDYDPLLSLDGGVDGLNPYHIIADGIKEYMTDETLLVIEFGYTQSDAVQQIFINNGYELVEKTTDLAGHIRTHTYKI